MVTQGALRARGWPRGLRTPSWRLGVEIHPLDWDGIADR